MPSDQLKTAIHELILEARIAVKSLRAMSGTPFPCPQAQRLEKAINGSDLWRYLGNEELEEGLPEAGTGTDQTFQAAVSQTFDMLARNILLLKEANETVATLQREAAAAEARHRATARVVDAARRSPKIPADQNLMLALDALDAEPPSGDTKSGLSLYLAGPMTGYLHNNFPAFEAAAKKLRAAGHTVASPHELAGSDLSESEIHAAFKLDFKAIIEAGNVVLLPGWQDSRGVAAELVVAKMVGATVFEFQEDLSELMGRVDIPEPVIGFGDTEQGAGASQEGTSPSQEREDRAGNAAPAPTSPEPDSFHANTERAWLEQQLNRLPYIDPYDDEAAIVDAMLPVAGWVRLLVKRAASCPDYAEPAAVQDAQEWIAAMREQREAFEPVLAAAEACKPQSYFITDDGPTHYHVLVERMTALFAAVEAFRSRRTAETEASLRDMHTFPDKELPASRDAIPNVNAGTAETDPETGSTSITFEKDAFRMLAADIIADIEPEPAAESGEDPGPDEPEALRWLREDVAEGSELHIPVSCARDLLVAWEADRARINDLRELRDMFEAAITDAGWHLLDGVSTSSFIADLASARDAGIARAEEAEARVKDLEGELLSVQGQVARTGREAYDLDLALEESKKRMSGLKRELTRKADEAAGYCEDSKDAEQRSQYLSDRRDEIEVWGRDAVRYLRAANYEPGVEGALIHQAKGLGLDKSEAERDEAAARVRELEEEMETRRIEALEEYPEDDA